MHQLRPILAAVILSSVIISGCAREKKAAGPVTVINKVGTVSLNTPGNELPLNASLGKGDMILTGDKSMATLLFPEQSAVRVYENSVFIVSKMEPAGTAGDDDTEFAAERGKALFIIAKLKKSGSFRVTTPTAVASVRGTSFVVTVEEKGEAVTGPATGVKVLRGSVHVAAINRPKAGALAGDGQMIEISGTTTAVEPKAMPVKELDGLKKEEAALESITGRSEEALTEEKSEASTAAGAGSGKPAPVLKTEKAIKEYYHKLEEVSLDDGTMLIGAVIYQDRATARIHTPHGIVQVPTRSIKTIRMR